MARYTGPVCRLCRREGEKLFLKGEKCYTEKCPVDRRPYPPGQHGQGRRPRLTEYGIHLREKQKLRRIYGVLERQFRRYYQEASRRKGVTGETLLQLLECRLDNVVYRLGFAPSRAAARQLVMHGHFTVNGKKMDIPSARVKVGDVIAVRERSRNIAMIKESVQAAQSRGVPDWLELDADGLKGTVKSLPTREQIDVRVQEHLIVEHYSR
ncbi:MAG: 30S ribosomal protein S4 [Clostridia bacterium]|nr:30S ribosomal protein S4 [Bacillota bacterium]MBO2520888.1 30S ribosomal protein S4 [Bacillota bacterium]